MGTMSEAVLSPEQKLVNDLWEEHLRHEFVTRDTEATLDTMVPDAYVNHVPAMTGGGGRDELRQFYLRRFIPQMPPDTEIVPISRTIGTGRVVDEMIFRFTHTIEMEWMLPGVAPTGKRVEVALVVIVQFREGKVAHEHIYWDQASAMAQLGLLDPADLPCVGAEAARKVAEPHRPANELIGRAEARRGRKPPTLYMVVERFRNRDPVPVYRRFREQGRLAPDGLRYVSSWVTADMAECYQLMECADPSLLEQWVARWQDLV